MARILYCLTALTLCLCTPIGAFAADFVDGELVIWFWDEESTILSTTDSTVSCVDPSLDAVLQSLGVESGRALFGPQSLLRNIFLLRFSPQTDLDDAMSTLAAQPEVRDVTKNWIGGCHLPLDERDDGIAG
jgi:hypothetical protein